MTVKLPPMPRRITRLPLNPDGYPIPWFAADGTDNPDFRLLAHDRVERALLGERCWICGDRMGTFQTYVAGPMCGINRTSAEPPSHHDCATWSALACPFLSNPAKSRRAADGAPPPGMSIKRNPGVTMLWTTRKPPIAHRIPAGQLSDGTPVGAGLLLVLPDPQRVEWLAHGRPATLGEVLHSVNTGLPELRRVAELGSPGELESLEAAVEDFARWYPKADT